MKIWPEFNDQGDLPPGIHKASLYEVIDHISSQNYEGASIFWLRPMSALESEEEAINYWQLKRDGNKRGIVEVLSDDK